MRSEQWVRGRKVIGVVAGVGAVAGVVWAANTVFSPNTGFGSSGNGLGTALGSASFSNGVAVDRNDPSDPNDHIYSLISTLSSNNNNGSYYGPFYIVRRNSNGTIDSTFGNGNPITFPNSTTTGYSFQSLCIDPTTHNIVVVGQAPGSGMGGPVMIAERLVPPVSGNGAATADPTFNATGMVTVASKLSNGNINPRGCAVSGDQTIVLYGSDDSYTQSSSSGNTQTAGSLIIAEFTGVGLPVVGFGTSGVAEPALSLKNSSNVPLFPQADIASFNPAAPNNHDIVLAGNARDASNSKSTREPLVVAVNYCTGALDANFNGGTNGGVGYLLNPSYDSTSFNQAVLAAVQSNDATHVTFIQGTDTPPFVGDVVDFGYPLATNGAAVSTSGTATLSFPAGVTPNGGITENSAGNLPLGVDVAGSSSGSNENIYEFLGESSLGFTKGTGFINCTAGSSSSSSGGSSSSSSSSSSSGSSSSSSSNSSSSSSGGGSTSSSSSGGSSGGGGGGAAGPGLLAVLGLAAAARRRRRG